MVAAGAGRGGQLVLGPPPVQPEHAPTRPGSAQHQLLELDDQSCVAEGCGFVERQDKILDVGW